MYDAAALKTYKIYTFILNSYRKLIGGFLDLFGSNPYPINNSIGLAMTGHFFDVVSTRIGTKKYGFAMEDNPILRWLFINIGFWKTAIFTTLILIAICLYFNHYQNTVSKRKIAVSNCVLIFILFCHLEVSILNFGMFFFNHTVDYVILYFFGVFVTSGFFAVILIDAMNPSQPLGASK